MGLRRIEYRGLRPLKIGLSLPAGIYDLPDEIADQIKAAAPMSVDDAVEKKPAAEKPKKPAAKPAAKKPAARKGGS